jgi:peptidoglycan lytic transglycosylase
VKPPAFIVAALAIGVSVALAQSPVTPTASREAQFTANEHAAETQDASHGLATFYNGTQTASGEKFNALELTAAHRTLPFGTWVRVTDVVTGRSVTVRINDRGPFTPGRIIDITHSAAEVLGIIEQGIAKVTLDIVQ